MSKKAAVLFVFAILVVSVGSMAIIMTGSVGKGILIGIFFAVIIFFLLFLIMRRTFAEKEV